MQMNDVAISHEPSKAICRDPDSGSNSARAPAVTQSYFTRFQTTATGGPPCDGVGCVHLNSSPLTDRLDRFWLDPFQFGNELPSMFRIRSVPLTE